MFHQHILLSIRLNRIQAISLDIALDRKQGFREIRRDCKLQWDLLTYTIFYIIRRLRMKIILFTDKDRYDTGQHAGIYTQHSRIQSQISKITPRKRNPSRDYSTSPDRQCRFFCYVRQNRGCLMAIMNQFNRNLFIISCRTSIWIVICLKCQRSILHKQVVDRIDNQLIPDFIRNSSRFFDNFYINIISRRCLQCFLERTTTFSPFLYFIDNNFIYIISFNRVRGTLRIQ